MTITVLAAIRNGRFYFSGLHQDILVFRDDRNDIEFIETSGMWIGILDDIENLVQDDNLILGINDSMILFTDGITEAWIKGSEKDNQSIDKDMYSAERLGHILKRNGKKTSKEIMNSIIKSLKGYTPDDDITLVVIKRVR